MNDIPPERTSKESGNSATDQAVIPPGVAARRLGWSLALFLVLSAPVWMWLQHISQSESELVAWGWSHHEVLRWLDRLKAIDGFLGFCLFAVFASQFWIAVAERENAPKEK
jgi:hypothetical protein